MGLLAVVRPGRVSTRCVMRTLRGSVIMPIAKPSHAEASVLRKVLGRLQDDFDENITNFSYRISVLMSLVLTLWRLTSYV